MRKLNRRVTRAAVLFVAGSLLLAREARAQVQLGCNATTKKCAQAKPEVLKGNFTFLLQDASACSASPLGKVVWRFFGTQGGDPEADASCINPHTTGDKVSYACTWERSPTPGPKPWNLQATMQCGAALALQSNGEGGGAATEQGEVAPGLSFLPPSTWESVIATLRLPLSGSDPGNFYSRRKNVAVLFFDAGGQPYYPMLDVIDEDDDVYVAVVDDKRAMNGIEISVSGCNRPPSEGRVYGTITEAAKGVRSGDLTPMPDIAIIIRAVGKCAGAETGGPVVNFRQAGRQSSVTIPVNPLYRFAVGVALAHDGTDQRSFDVRPAGGDTVPRVVQTSERIGLTSLIYVSLYLSPRDFRKTRFWLWQRAQLFVGLDPRAFSDHLVAGAGYELAPGLNLLAGWRVLTRQPVLAEGSGLTNGSTFDPPQETLPLRNRWESGGVFFGLGLSSNLIARLR